MSLRANYDTDSKLELDGVWETMCYNDDETPIEFLIARRGGANKDFDKELELQTRPHRAAIDAGKMPAKLQTEISKRVFVKTVLRDWRGVQQNEFDESGSTELVPYSPEKALELFSLMDDIYTDAAVKSVNRERFMRQKREDVAKNL